MTEKTHQNSSEEAELVFNTVIRLNRMGAHTIANALLDDGAPKKEAKDED